MKFRVVLLVSILLNASLVGGWWLTTRPRPVKEPAQVQTAAPVSAVAPQSAQRRAPRIITQIKSDTFDWTKVESDDYRKYIANLRAIGCPEETVRDIIITDINKLYAGKIATLYPSPKDFKFWQARTRENRETQRERDRKVRDLEKEKHDLVKELLGVDMEVEMAKQSGEPDQDDWRTGWLSQEKQDQIRVLYEKYREQERAAFTNGNGWDPQNRTKYLALRAQREVELAQMLTPEEFQEYQLRNSSTARNMRDNLASFSPSESEFKEIFQIKKAFDDQYGFTRGGGDDALRQQRELAQQQLDEQLRATLGEERYHQYQLAQDDNYRNLYDLMQRNNLPVQTAQTIYDVRKLAEGERSRIEKDPTLQPDERAALLVALAQTTQQSLGQALGDNFTKYRQAGGGSWLEKLSQDPSKNQRGPGQDQGGRGDRERNSGRGGPR